MKITLRTRLRAIPCRLGWHAWRPWSPTHVRCQRCAALQFTYTPARPRWG